MIIQKNLLVKLNKRLICQDHLLKKILDKIIIKNIKDFIKKSTGKNIKKVKIKNFWVVRQYSNEYNPVHFHDGHISGVGYLKVPKFINKGKKNLKQMEQLILLMEIKCF